MKAEMDKYEYDRIIAFGGGTIVDICKVLACEIPAGSADLFTGKVAPKRVKKLVLVPTTCGTGSEVTPFAIITDAETGVKWPIADYELLPNMAIVDVDNMMTQPKGLTSASGIDVMTHAIEAYVSIMASDYTEGLSLKAIKDVFNYLPSAYPN